MQPPIPSPQFTPREDRPSGLSPQTLIIASVASVAAAFTVARVWGPGTLIGAAAAPVIVAVVAESLRRPMRRVTATAQRVPTARLVPGVSNRAIVAANHPAEHSCPVRMARDPVTPDPGPDVHANDVTRRRPRWRLAVATGGLAFAIVVGAFTVPDLLAGYSITGSGEPTTFFGSSTIIEKATGPAITVTTTIPVTPTSTTPRASTTSATRTVTTPAGTVTTPTDTQTITTPTTRTTPTTTPATTTTAPPTAQVP